MNHDTMYAKQTNDVTTTITIGPDDRGTIRSVRGDDVHVKPLLFPAILTFDNHDTVKVPDRDKLDRILVGQKGYARFSL